MDMDKPDARMTDEQAADWYYEHRNDPDFAGETVEVRRSGRLSRVYSVRFSPDEAERLEFRARQAGMTVSQYIRQAVTSVPIPSQASGDLGGELREIRATLDRLERKVGKR